MDMNEIKNNSPKRPVIFYYAIALIVLLALNFLLVPWMSERSVKETGYNEFLSQVSAGNVTEVEVQEQNAVIYYKVNVNGREEVCKTGTMNDPELVDRLNQANVKFGSVIPQKQSMLGTLIFSWVIPILIFVLIGNWLSKKMAKSMGGGPGSMMFGKSNAKIYVKSSTGIKFSDVAGEDEAKELLTEIVDYLHHPERYQDIGAQMPKGALLVGPPGTGKTLLAKAVAGEAGVPFFSISGSDFVEMFVGVGASRVRDLFEEGKKNAPCIIFIDEIDAVARKRGTGMGGGHDEREQTLNQLLVEMDGFGVNEGIIVMAATNRVDILDPAILRPGRFDRKVGVGRPDIKGREEILKVHVRKKPLGEDVDLHEIARTTAGFTGADLENLMNEAAILTAKDGRYYLTQKDIRQAFVKVGIGAEKKSKVISEKEKKITAYHEAGHAILFHLLPNMGPVHTISIIPTGLGAAGYTMPLPEADEMFNSKNKMLENIVVDLGGRVAEELIFKDVTTGASQDIKQATQLARAMVTQYGMSDKVGLINYGSDEDEVFIGRDLAHTRNYGEQTAAVIDSEVKRIIDEAYSQAKELIGSHIDVLHKCVELLLEKEKIGREEFEALFSENEEQKSLENDLGGTLYDLTKR